jgi:hypothetical protein
MKRRSLDFGSFDALRAEVLRLRVVPYTRAGAWSLGQNCEHIAKMMDQSIDGFEAKLPWIVRAGGPLVKWWLFRSRRMPSGVKAPPSFMPGDEVADDAGADRLLAALDRYTSYSGPMQPSPLLGAVSREEWDQIHLIHASHHLSFIVPGEPNPAASRGAA